MRGPHFLFSLLLVAACAPGSEAPAPDPSRSDAAAAAVDASAAESVEPSADACGADQLGRWLNALPTTTVKAEIRQAVGHDRVRYIAPAGTVTMDWRPDRLNVETGGDGRIKRFRCG